MALSRRARSLARRSTSEAIWSAAMRLRRPSPGSSSSCRRVRKAYHRGGGGRAGSRSLAGGAATRADKRQEEREEGGKTMNRKHLLASTVGVLVAAAIAGGVAYATIPGPDNVYSACMLKGTGTIRLIDKSLPASNLMSHCTDKETEISWNQAGQPGPAGPQGAKGEPGAPGTNGTNGTNGKDGVNVTSEPEPAGANCAAGGSKVISANGVTYPCQGAKGDPGVSWAGGGGLTGREL